MIWEKKTGQKRVYRLFSLQKQAIVNKKTSPRRSKFNSTLNLKRGEHNTCVIRHLSCQWICRAQMNPNLLPTLLIVKATYLSLDSKASQNIYHQNYSTIWLSTPHIYLQWKMHFYIKSCLRAKFSYVCSNIVEFIVVKYDIFAL